jgi:hypothetical protein
MPNFSFWQKWLFIVALAVTLFGIVMVFISGTSLFDLFNHQINPAFWGTNVVDVQAKQFQNWVYGLWGATIAGWGIVLAFLVYYPFNRKEKWAWNCLVIGLSVWFVLDTGLSAIYRVYFNVIFNTVLIVLAMLPIVFSRKDF